MSETWTMKQLAEIDDLIFIQSILNERRRNLNPYAPLSQKISKVNGKIDRKNIFQCPIDKVFNPETNKCVNPKQFIGRADKIRRVKTPKSDDVDMKIIHRDIR